MPAPVTIIFRTQGEAQIASVFDGVEKRIRKMNQAVANDSARAAKAQIANAQSSSKTVEAFQKRLMTLSDQVAKSQAKSADDAAKKQAKAASDAAKAQLRSFDERLKASKRFAIEEERNVDRVAKAQAKAAAAAATQMAARDRAMARGIVQPFGRAARSTFGAVTGVAGMMGLTGGSMLIGNAVMGGLNLQRQAALLSNATAVGGKPAMSVGDLLGSARSTAMQTGFGAGNVMESMNTVAARSGREGLIAFKQDLADVARTALASGTTIEDMGAVYAAAFKAGVKPGQEMQQLMRDLVSQGKEGAVEFADLASELAKLAGAGKSWGSGADMIRRASGLAQIAVESAVSPEESRTAVVDMVREFTQGPKIQALKNAGISVEGAGGKNRDPAELLSEIIDRAETKGIGKHGYKGQAALSEIFTGKSQQDIVRNLRESYLGGYTSERTGRKYSGKEAVRQRIVDASASTMTAEQRDAEFQKVMGTDMQKIAVAMERFGSEMDKLLPKISEMIPTVTSLTEKLANVVTWAAQNPFTALGGIFAAYLTKELAAVGLSKLLETGLRNVIANNPLAGAGGGLGAGGNAAAFASIALTATAVYLTGKTVIDETVEAGKKRGAGVLATNVEAQNLLSELKATGGAGMSKEQVQKQIAALQQAEAGKSKGVQAGWYDALFATPLAAVPAAIHGYQALSAQGEREGAAGGVDANELIGKLNAWADRLPAASLANPGNQARQGKPAGM